MDLFSRLSKKQSLTTIKYVNEYERLSSEYLQQRGLEFLQANYRCHLGEIDLIFKDNSALVFIEVRYRKHSGYGGAAASVSQRKQRKIILTAKHFLQNNPLGITPEVDCRFDVMSLSPDRLQPDNLKFDWIKNAFCS